MKKISLRVALFAFSMFIVIGAKANPVDTNTAKIVAKNFLQKHDASVKNTNIFRISQVARANGLSNLYILERTDKAGFVVISADDCVQPVLAYSTTSEAGNEIPVNALDWFRGYDGEIAYCVSNNVQATEGVLLAWRELLSTSSRDNGVMLDGGIPVVSERPMAGAAVVGPLLSTTWNQAPLYNNYCPYDTTYNDRTVVGCVATAMAQVMKYWNYPTRGIGSKTYHAYSYSGNSDYGVLSVNFGNTTYDWANMPNALTASSTQAQIHAVATLSYHCGVAVEMMYGVSSQGGSSAYTNGNNPPTAEYALKNIFGYKSTAASAYRNNYSDANWDALLRTDLNANRPLLYRGSGTGGGHAFVCDGYDNEGLFHYNWGWGGSYDGFFASNNLAPGGGGIGSNQSNTFNTSQAVVYGIEPDNSSLVVRPEMLTIPSNGGSQVISVRPSNSDTNGWTATTNYPWISLSANSGAGAGLVTNITVTVQPNLSGYNRTGLITVIQHNDTVVVPVSQTFGNNSASGRYGNVEVDYFTNVDSGYTVAIRPECFGNFNAGDTVKSIFYRTYNSSYYPAYMDSVFVINIYENPVYTATLAQGNRDSMSNVLGNLVYTQTYYQRTQGENVVSLNTPYVINNNRFWITLTSVGKSQLLFAVKFLSDSVLMSAFPIVDSIDGKYLRGYSPMINAAFSGMTADDTNYVYQYNSHFMFGFYVSTGSPVVINARPDSVNHGYVLGGGSYGVGDTVTLTANALPGYSFVRWSDSVNMATRTFVIQPNTHYPEYVALYNARTPYRLSVVSSNQQ
ncbi:MAG: C10 family peptidase, partial [Bacteroidales bacterium]|nr:C10 family peptidase [Bacteroidales bacterium]